MADATALQRLTLLKEEHRDLDGAIDALLVDSRPDQLRLARLKKRKLRLRDEIAAIEDALLPDIIA
ncbi:hypothetical protein GGR88_001004 [Sphingomonas jejuensis]|uniref:DUF465 domain-containing protein n=1 Tax=Sphingomonas jejuensis TaxID=904715 RepID=A0ABX0XLD1_9SPHN|nr:DUF465 domain-containing protein [Sphingomonas jejuensis]NJC33530.1 hypothetical protein [Sphingomonas jejuensis]